ncbi:uncharacterized protein LOC105662629 [Megachile rotundata]|uniref:uncharacterized protein LOC105662629 n=1 Tax=Megachile rotundata TaxID=143995 RepID=UPI003FD19210
MSAIKDFESARLMTKFDFKLSDAEIKSLYSRQLAAAYRRRGDWYFENDMMMEALSDYEQVFVLKMDDQLMTTMQDQLLKLLRKLDKYEMFQRYWNDFLKDSDPVRTSVLFAVHAEYKIHLKQMAIARHMLLKALDLDKSNVEARRLLEIVYSTGDNLITYTILWCMHGCYDKGLLTIEKALDCNPYNPGYILLKTIVLRLSGRFDEATSWLENISKNFYKLLEPKDTQSSILGKLSINETRNELIKQWYLIRYDRAMEFMLNDKLQNAARMIYESELTKYYMEPYITLGDIFLKRDNVELALQSYLKCHERVRELRLPASRKTIDLTERIIDILNERAQVAVNEGRLKDAINITDQVLQILDGKQTELHHLGIQRGRALLYKARSLFRAAIKKKEQNKECCEIAADSLRFVREPNDADLYRTLYGERSIEDIIDRYAPKRKLPGSLKILMQFS